MDVSASAMMQVFTIGLSIMKFAQRAIVGFLIFAFGGSASSEESSAFFKYAYKVQSCARTDATVLLHDGWIKKEWGAEDSLIHFELTNPQFEWDMLCADEASTTCSYERPLSPEDRLQVTGYKYNDNEVIVFSGHFPLYSSRKHGQIHIDESTNVLTWSRLAPKGDQLITFISAFECEEIPS